MPRKTEKTKNIKNKAVKKPEEVKLAYPEPVDKNRVMLMWSAVIFFSVLLVFGWFINSRNVFRSSVPVEPLVDSSADWKKIGEEMSQALQELKFGMETVKDAASQLSTATTSQDISVEATSSDLINMDQSATSTASEIQNSAAVDPAELENLKIELEKIQTKLK
jgi:hypothetical protein